MRCRIFGVIALLVLVVGGCMEGTESGEVDTGFEFVTPGGIRYRVEGAARAIEPDAVDSAYQEAVECVGAWVDPAAARLLTTALPSLPGGYLGTFEAPALVRIGDAGPATEQEWLYVHEFIHFLLFQLTRDPDVSHTHPCFARY